MRVSTGPSITDRAKRTCGTMILFIVFFQEHFLHWLEAISLMGKGSEMAAIIRMY